MAWLGQLHPSRSHLRLPTLAVFAAPILFHGLGVVLHLTGLGIDIDGTAVAIGDVRQMRELRADLGITDFGIERFIGTDGVQEICEVKAVIPFAGIGLHLFASEIKLLVASTVNLQGSAFAVEGAERPLLLAARMAAEQAALLVRRYEY